MINNEHEKITNDYHDKDKLILTIDDYLEQINEKNDKDKYKIKYIDYIYPQNSNDIE